jgi:hypothetical protein
MSSCCQSRNVPFALRLSRGRDILLVPVESCLHFPQFSRSQLSAISYQSSVISHQLLACGRLGLELPPRNFLSRNLNNSKELPLGC